MMARQFLLVEVIGSHFGYRCVGAEEISEDARYLEQRGNFMIYVMPRSTHIPNSVILESANYEDSVLSIMRLMGRR